MSGAEYHLLGNLLVYGSLAAYGAYLLRRLNRV